MMLTLPRRTNPGIEVTHQKHDPLALQTVGGLSEEVKDLPAFLLWAPRLRYVYRGEDQPARGCAKPE
eukprot:1397030-Alexandrium_andersonii.AAC.1